MAVGVKERILVIRLLEKAAAYPAHAGMLGIAADGGFANGEETENGIASMAGHGNPAAECKENGM